MQLFREAPSFCTECQTQTSIRTCLNPSISHRNICTDIQDDVGSLEGITMEVTDAGAAVSVYEASCWAFLQTLFLFDRVQVNWLYIGLYRRECKHLLPVCLRKITVLEN